jgi:hypothetical protein
MYAQADTTNSATRKAGLGTIGVCDDLMNWGSRALVPGSAVAPPLRVLRASAHITGEALMNDRPKALCISVALALTASCPALADTFTFEFSSGGATTTGAFTTSDTPTSSRRASISAGRWRWPTA